MTNPDREELLGYADSLNQQAIWIEEALAPETPDSQRIGIEDIDIDELRGASDLLRRLASSDSGVKVRELAWRRIGDCWKADRYSIRVDHGVPVYYIVSGWASGTNPCDTLDAAKVAAQADYEARIKSALVEVPAVKGEPEPVAWPNGCDKTVPAALRYLADHERPYGGQSSFNSEHLYQLAGEIERMASQRLYTAPPADAGMREALGKYAEVLVPFVSMMAAELRANSGKGDRPGWLQMDRKTGLLEILYHLAKLQKAVKDNDQYRIREYGADVANMAMMLVDICGALPNTALTAPGATTKSDGGDLDARFKRLEKEATDLGYVLTPEPEHPDSPHSVRETLLRDQWSLLVEKDDRTSPEEYPDMCLITREEVGNIIDAALRGNQSDAGDLCEDCPPVGYPTDKTRCSPCPRRTQKSDGVPGGAVGTGAAAAPIETGDAVVANGPSDPSSTRSEVELFERHTGLKLEITDATRSEATVEIKHLISSARAFLAHFNPCDLAEDKSQQWQSLEHQCNRAERALLDQFEIRRK